MTDSSGRLSTLRWDARRILVLTPFFAAGALLCRSAPIAGAAIQPTYYHFLGHVVCPCQASLSKAVSVYIEGWNFQNCSVFKKIFWKNFYCCVKDLLWQSQPLCRPFRHRGWRYVNSRHYFITFLFLLSRPIRQKTYNNKYKYVGCPPGERSISKKLPRTEREKSTTAHIWPCRGYSLRLVAALIFPLRFETWRKLNLSLSILPCTGDRKEAHLFTRFN